ncbi:MAG TPA: DMT family transporter [Acidimicrobiia bacterium]|jgi:drug/metabolite transporter (DMT)-like permease|nr:DMT family transporter [Acidimicrobiia bacterium]
MVAGVLITMATTRLISTAHGTNREAFTAIDWTLFLALSGIWGSSFLLMAIGLDSFHPGVVTFIRVSLGACFLGLLPRTRAVRIDREDWPRIVLLAATWVGIPFTLFPIAQQWIDSAVAGMLNGSTPIFTAVIATILLRALPGPRQILGLFIGFAGIMAIALPSAGEGTTAAIGVVLVMTATLGYAISLNIATPLQQKYGSLPVMARVLATATVLVLPFGLAGLGNSSLSWASLLAVAATGVLGTGLAFILVGSLLGSVGATRTSFITYLIPVVALILGVVFRDEIISPVAIAGVGLVIAGAILASRRESNLRSRPS